MLVVIVCVLFAVVCLMFAMSHGSFTVCGLLFVVFCVYGTLCCTLVTVYDVLCFGYGAMPDLWYLWCVVYCVLHTVCRTRACWRLCLRALLFVMMTVMRVG